MKRFLFVVPLALTLTVSAQSILEMRLDGSEQDKKLIQFLQEFERSHNVQFFFLDEWLAPYTIEGSYQGQTLADLLTVVLRESDLSVVQVHDRALAFVKDPRVEIERRAAIQVATRKEQVIEKATVGNPDLFRPGRMVTVRGRITEEENGEPIIGATVVPNSQRGTTTDREGLYELQLPSGRHVLSVNFIGFKERIVDLNVYDGGLLNLSLQESPTLLEEVVISSQPINELTNSRPGQLQLSVGAMKKAPALMGEADLVRQLQSLPGVNTVGEAAAGFNVRGGSIDQNLVLYDGLPLFNTSHALGFFSAFNSEAVQDMSFYRGGIPAEYGGRVSSVLDIRSKPGDLEKWKVNGGIGLVSANIMARGPITKNKTTIAVGGRGTYANWYIDLLKNTYKDLTNSQIGFYDAEVRIDHKLNEKSRLAFSYYRSFDKLRVRGDTSFQWVNQLASLQLVQVFSQRLTGNFELGFGDYNYTVTDEIPANGFELNYKITYPTVKADFSYVAGKHRFGFGIQGTYYAFKPGELKPTSDISSVRSVTMNTQQALESGVYVSDSYTLSEKINLDLGLRLSMFANLGPTIVNVYNPASPVEKQNLVDSISYGSGEPVATFQGLEPRAAIRFSLNEQSSLKLSYQHIYQYLHLISNTAAVTPVDIWQPSNTFFKPQVADQISFGYFRDFKKKTYETYAEVFYKDMNQVLDFKNGAQLILNKQLEADLIQGRGKAYGLETYISKGQGRLTWALSYTYSRSLRTIPGINGGETYPSNFDQPHMINFAWNYRFNKRFSFTGNFMYRTGRPVTVPSYGFTTEGYGVAYFSGRNQYRIPDYHRLDIAFVIEGSHKLKKPWTGQWIISFLNVYAHRNAYSYFFASDTPGQIKTYQLSILGSIIPSVTYNFKF